MRENGIVVERTRKFKATTDSDHTFNIAPNLAAVITFGTPKPLCSEKGVAIDTKIWYLLALARR
jgi:hypothetical protein